jgi:hypothetical protein
LWWIGSSQYQSISFDIDNFTSVSTRGSLLLISLVGLLLNPFGYGYYGFYGVMHDVGGFLLQWLSANLDLSNLNLSEVSSIIESLINLSTKSTLLDFTLIFGVPFIALLVMIIRRIDLSDVRAKFALFYLLFTALSTSGHESIIFFLGLAVLIMIFPRRTI